LEKMMLDRVIATAAEAPKLAAPVAERNDQNDAQPAKLAVTAPPGS
jgi:hypothetical protein